jgi:hypothetical protein
MGGAAVASTAVTAQVDLPTPAGVQAKCGLTMLTDGKLIARCRFTNTTGQRQRFLYCMMIDLRADLRAPVSGTSGDHVIVHRSGGTVNCTKVDATGAFSPTSFHFGCEEVDLQPAVSTIIVFESASTYQPPPGLSVKAQDFLVTYADDAILNSSDTYDPSNCRLGAGEEQAGFVTFDFASGLVGAYWVVLQVPFVDPFIQLQSSIEGEPGPKEYSLFEDAPCLPPGFPEDVAQLSVCPEAEGEPPAMEVDLNLFYYVTHMAGEDEIFPAVISVETQGEAEGVRIETDPPAGVPFEIQGGEERIGSLRACAAQITDRCEAPELPEGQTLTVTVEVSDPETNRLLFPQVIEFIADTKPPEVESATVSAGELEVVATDEVTSALGATIWISTDGGETWGPRMMDPDPSIDAELVGERVQTRRFTAPIPEEPDGVRYFVIVQDAVFNLLFLGPQEV